MGTRGLYGFRKNGIDKTTYNQYDSYPDCLGETMVRFCKETSIKEMNEIFDRIVLVDGRSKPNAEQIKECIKYYNENVGTNTVNDWYCLLREAQGNPNAYKDGLKYMLDDHDFIKESLWCEYAYIVNLDTNCLEFWKGFQSEPSSGRYGTEVVDGYYPCKMLSYYNLEHMDSTVHEYVNDMNNMCE